MQQKLAIITGGSSGIGLAITRELANSQVLSVIADIQPPTEKLPSQAVYIPCDISQQEDVESFAHQVLHTYGTPDILISNAGQGIHEKLSEGDPRKWAYIFNLNVCGALRFIRAFLPLMLEAGRGDVLFVSSVAAGQAYPYGGVYAATKAALEVIAETLRLETRAPAPGKHCGARV
ncbi:MAG: SDR family NAD(P)-dependent oxidoreductase [Bacteroidia bacterium]|nr:SDR family NAD(P)-dependent oxidoreductase [Bacteroidia bacterium]